MFGFKKTPEIKAKAYKDKLEKAVRGASTPEYNDIINHIVTKASEAGISIEETTKLLDDMAEIRKSTETYKKLGEKYLEK